MNAHASTAGFARRTASADGQMPFPLAPQTTAGSDDGRPCILLNHMVEPPGRITGITRYAFGLMEAMIRRGNARHVLVSAFTRDELPAAIASGLTEIITVPHVSQTPMNWLHQRRTLSRIAARIRPDAVYAFNPMCVPVAGAANVITVHDLYFELQPELYARRHRLWWHVFFRLAGRGADAIACASLNTARDLSRLHPKLAGKTAIVPGAGVLPAFAAYPGRICEEPYVLLLGNVTPNKNAGFLVDALARLRAEGRPVRAYHVGRDNDGELSCLLGGANAGLITPLGPLGDEQLDAILRNAHALVQPSRFEGFGLPIIEAHDRAVPVIASDIPVFRDVAGDGALFATLGDVKALAGAIARITGEPAFHARMAARARENAARFTWDRSAAAAEALTASLLTGNRATSQTFT